MKRRPPRSTHTDTLLSLHYALPIYGLDGTSPGTSAPTSVASPTAVAFAAGRSATNTRFMRPSLQVSQWRMNMRSKTMPVALLFSASSSFAFVHASTPCPAPALQSGNSPALNATRLPSGEILKPSTPTGNAVSFTGSPPAAGIEYSCDESSFALRKYTVVPSGENAGELTFQPSGVSRFGGAASRANRSSIHSEVLALPLSPSSTRLANTSLRPSGDSVGDE